MKYIYYKSKQGNFGDDLNPWLWPQLFDNVTNDTSDINFLGIGSILHQDNKLLEALPPKAKKIVFGTGIRPSYTKLTLDTSWDIKFLRGPMSARYMNYQYNHIADAAYALMQTISYNRLLKARKKYKVSIMPYYHSCRFLDWKKVADQLGYHYISPLSENGVEHTLEEIVSSELLITEAMHGAILADILRVPWHRFIFSGKIIEGGDISEFKWTDFLASVQIHHTEDTHISLYKKTFWNRITDRIPNHYVNAQFFLKSRVIDDLKRKLSAPEDYYLSSDKVINEINEKIGIEVNKLKQDLSLASQYLL